MASRRRFRFLELPPELREYVCKEAFKDEVAVHGSKLAKVHAPGVLLACKQIHLEAVKVFYSTATFRFWEYEFGFEWYIRLPGSYRNAITRIRFDLQTPNFCGGPSILYRLGGMFALDWVEAFWEDVEKHDLQRRRGILTARAVLRCYHAMPPEGLLLWDGETPTTAKIPKSISEHREVWVSEDLQAACAEIMDKT